MDVDEYHACLCPVTPACVVLELNMLCVHAVIFSRHAKAVEVPAADQYKRDLLAW
jgi:hypothetical protein